MVRRWELLAPSEPVVVSELSTQLAVTPLLAHLLLLRNIASAEEAARYFVPSSAGIHDPFLFPAMKKATDRIIAAKERDEVVAVYGDSDVDGLTALTVLTRFLRSMGIRTIPHIPQRSDTSYGLHEIGINELAAQEVSLIITVDVGITAVQAVEYANSQYIDVIITDHHEPLQSIPPAHAVINPKVDMIYPFRELSGCAVAFKLAQALAIREGRSWDDMIPLLEYVALGTAADIVPLTGENRILLALGMSALHESNWPGIVALADVAGITLATVSVDDMLMTLSPRLNAAARMGHPQRALQLLLSDDLTEAEQLAVMVEQDNYRRRGIDEGMMKDAIATIHRDCDLVNDTAIVLAKSDWHIGLIGILASRLAEMFHRPAVILAVENGVARGSARTVRDFDIHSALTFCSKYLSQYGGHRCAAGLTLNAKDVPDFARDFKQYVKEQAIHGELQPTLRFDAELPLDQVDVPLHKELQRMAPFGPGNPKPLFMAENVEVIGNAKIVGQRHLRFKVRRNGKVFGAIALGMADRFSELNGHHPIIDLCYAIESPTNHWDTPLQLRVQDFRITTK